MKILLGLLGLLLVIGISCNCVGLSRSVKDVVYEGSESVVRIHTADKGYCTGFVIDKSVVATAAHCIVTLDDVIIIDGPDGRKYVGSPFVNDDDLDIGLIYVVDLDLPPVVLKGTIDVGERLVLIGYPFYSPDAMTFEVSHFKRFETRVSGQTLLQSDCVFRGESGSPVFDERGFVVGMAILVKNHIDHTSIILHQHKDVGYFVLANDIRKVAGIQ